MGIELSKLVSAFEDRWPLELAEEWDSPGLVTGSPSQEVSRVLLTVDVTSATAQAAIDGKFDLLLAHHPFLLRGIKSLAEEAPKGAVLASAIRHGLAIYAAHTNADVVENGVSDILAKRLGLEDLVPLVPGSSSPTGPQGSGRVGILNSPTTLGEFALAVARALPATASGVRVAGDYGQIVSRVAVCGGAGDSFITAAIAARADVYVTSDLRHHVVQDARETAMMHNGAPALIDVSHWASEWLWLEQAAQELGRLF